MPIRTVRRSRESRPDAQQPGPCVPALEQHEPAEEENPGSCRETDELACSHVEAASTNAVPIELIAKVPEYHLNCGTAKRGKTAG
jgi:hypothetical protein